VLKAPVLSFCSFSKISWSCLGRRGGAGPLLNDVEWRVERVKARVAMARRERWRGMRVSVRCIVITVKCRSIQSK